MQRLIDRIHQQQKDMGYTAFCAESRENQMQYVRDIALALQKEVSEVLDELPWKSWVATDKQQENTEWALNELTDVMVFNIVLWVTLNPDKKFDFDYIMERTLQKIENRIKETNYGHHS